MTPYFAGSFGNPHSADHCLGWAAARAVENAAAQVAALIGADADEIFFTSGATEANNLALLGVGRRSAGGKRQRILVSSIEHKCVLAACRALQQQLGYAVERIPVDAQGRVVISELEKALNDNVLIVSMMAVNNEIGTIQNIERLSKTIKAHGALFHCDASQAPCATDIGLLAYSVDLLSLSAHKMYGPQGIGALFVRRELQSGIEPIVYGGGQQQGLRSGTVPVALCVGMGAAVVSLSGEEAAHEREMIRQRRDKFLQGLRALKWPVALNGPSGIGRHPGNANVRFKGFSAHGILGGLQPRLAASTGSACTSGIPEPSHVLRAIGLSEPEAEASIRFSLGRGTSDADVEEAIGLVDDVLAKLAGAGLAQTA